MESYIDTRQGTKLFKSYLAKFDGKTSQKVYRSEIRQFFKFYPGTLGDLSKKDFTRYLHHLGKSSKEKTIKRKFSILNQFFRHLETNIKGFTSPIGKKYGDMQDFRGGTYIESESFQNQVADWVSGLNCDNTKRTYLGAVRLFFKHTGKDLKDLVQDDFLKYRDHLTEKKNKPSTIWNKFIAIHSFLKFIDIRNRKFKNPMDFERLSLVPPQKDKGYYGVLSIKEAKALLRQPDRRTLIGRRDYLLLMLMITYGLRVNELCKLTYADLDAERVENQQRLWVRDRKGKRGNRATTAIILGGKAMEAFDEWVEHCGIPFQPATPIFVGFRWQINQGGLVIRWDHVREKKHLSTRAVEYVVEKHVASAGLNKREKVISSHALRHTALTLLAEAGVPVIELKNLAGHQNINTTMIYLHSTQSWKDHPGMKNPLNI